MELFYFNFKVFLKPLIYFIFYTGEGCLIWNKQYCFLNFLLAWSWPYLVARIGLCRADLAQTWFHSVPKLHLYRQNWDGIGAMLWHRSSCGPGIGTVLVPCCGTNRPVGPESGRCWCYTVVHVVPSKPEPVLPWTQVVTQVAQYKPQLVRYWSNADPRTVPSGQVWYSPGPLTDPNTWHIVLLLGARVGTILRYCSNCSWCVPTLEQHWSRPVDPV